MANDLLKEAIADAKAVRETALANAKIALEEAFTPRLQSMLSAKLAEEEDMDAPEPAEEPAEEPAMDVAEAEDAIETNGDGMDAAAGAPVDEGDHGEDDMKSEDLELEAIIRELEEELSEGEDDEMKSEGDHDDEMKSEGKDHDDDMKSEGEDDDMKSEGIDEDISIDEIINALREEEEGDDSKNEEVNELDSSDIGSGDNKVDADSGELAEAYNVIRFLKSKINEVNLLNAKLLFSNKLFKNHSMNESQKMTVIENFDRATSIREVKLVYATLSESLQLSGRKTKRSIKESYASTPSRSTAPKKRVISEGTDLTARWKKLANL